MNRHVFGLVMVAVCGLVACDPIESSGSDATGGDSSGSTSGTSGGGGDPLGAVVAHNAVRRAVQPTPAEALPDMTWDAGVAAAAQAWADGCVFDHDDNRGTVGENIYVTSGSATAADVVNSWASEVKDYDYESNSCTDVCGHYTQIVWRDSVKVGCGFKDCANVEGFGAGQLWVCRYSPPGNYRGEKPY